MNNNITLGELGKVRMCKRVLKHQTSEDESIPFYKISTFGDDAQVFISKELYEEFKDKYPYPKVGDVLISAAGTIGKTVIFDGQPSYFQDSNIVWIENDETIVTNSFLYYFYQTSPWVSTNGSTIKRLYNDNLRSIKISYPKLENQKQIAKVLSDLDAKIEVNNRINQQLEAMAKTLYDYWFVQFDFPTTNVSSSAVENDSTTSNKEPVSTALDMTKAKPYKSSGGKMVYNEELKREIPDGWESGNIFECAQLLTGGTPKKNNSSYWNGRIPFYTPVDASNQIFSTETISYTNQLGIDNSSARILPKGTTIITARGSVGKLNLTGIEMAMNQSCYAFFPLENYSSEYVYFKSKEVINYLKVKSSGSVFKSIVTNDIKYSYSVIAPSKIVNQFSKIVKPIFENVLKNQKENQKLMELRDWLLPMLMNGQVQVNSNSNLN